MNEDQEPSYYGYLAWLLKEVEQSKGVHGLEEIVSLVKDRIESIKQEDLFSRENATKTST